MIADVEPSTAREEIPPDGLYNHGDSNTLACQSCDMTAIYALWAAALNLYMIDLRYAYRQNGDPHGVRYDFENGCRKLRRLIDPPGFELAIVRKAFIRRLVEGGLLTTDQAIDLAD